MHRTAHRSTDEIVLDNATLKRLREATEALRRVTAALRQSKLAEVGR